MPKISDARRDQRRQQILEAAWKCFEREGLHATTMQDIIRACGLSAGAVYGYFRTKDDLIMQAVVESLSSLRARLAPVLAERPRPDLLLCQVCREISDFARREGYDLRRIALLGWAEAQRNPVLRSTMQSYYGEFRQALRRLASGWREAGFVASDAEDDLTAKVVLAAILGFVVQSALLGDVDAKSFSKGFAGLSTGPARG